MPFKLLSYFSSPEENRARVPLDHKGYHPARVGTNTGYADMMGVLNDWKKAKKALADGVKLIEAGKSRAKGTPLKKTKLAAPVPAPGVVFCAGANYKDHADNMARKQGKEPDPDPHTQGLNPWHFQKAPRSCVVGPGAKVKLPVYSQKVDWELELGVVIGMTAKNVPLAKALDYVAGYTIGNDLSARDMTKRPHLPDDSGFKF